jgi:hypothetical protein
LGNEKTKTDRWPRWLADAGLVEISPEQFPERIKEVKRVAMGRLQELLELKTGVEEQQCIAHSLGTFKRLETILVVHWRETTR